MKKLITILCILALTLSLAGCAKIRDLNCYSVGQYGDGWSILYTDEDGVEEIASMGSYAQPLAFEKGRFYFVQNGCMVSVDAEGENRQEVAVETLPEGALITFVDEENYYCLADRGGAKCWRFNKSDVTDYEEIDIPTAFRPSFLHQLEVETRAVAPAKDDQIRVRGMRAVTDGNGSLLTLTLELLCLDSENGFNLRTWRTCRVELHFTLDGVETKYINENLLLSLADSTISQTMELQDCTTALRSLLSGGMLAATAQDKADSFRVTYLADEYTAQADTLGDALRYRTVNGDEASASSNAHRFLVAQIGGCEVQFTDHDGAQCGNLMAVIVD